jgi:hypothetical protein
LNNISPINSDKKPDNENDNDYDITTEFNINPNNHYSENTLKENNNEDEESKTGGLKRTDDKTKQEESE